jgi:hypothetical protein
VIEIKRHYENAHNIQRQFSDGIKDYKEKMIKLRDELDKLQNNFFDIAGRPVTIDLEY